MDVHDKLAELRTRIDQARTRPMSSSATVNRTELLGLVDELSTALDAALAESRRALEERDSVLADARAQASRILADGQAERDKLVTGADVQQSARKQADRLLTDARVDADELRREADDYVDAKLANFEITLQRTTEAVQRAVRTWPAPSAYAGITSEEVDKVALPEHLSD